MDKSTTKNLIGQPIFSQILKLIPRTIISGVVRQTRADRYYKRFKTYNHLIAMLFSTFSRCNSIREICTGMLACEGKLNHLGLTQAPKRSTFSDSNKNRDSGVFEAIYYALYKRYASLLSDSRNISLSLKQLFIVDSTTISLFSDILKGAGRNPKGNGKKKGGIKVHTLMDALEGVPKLVRYTAAAIHDHTFLKFLKFPKGSFVVFDKAYTDFKIFANWVAEEVYFITRMKDNAVYEGIEEIDIPVEMDTGVLKDEVIQHKYKDNKEEKIVKLRRIAYWDGKGEKLFIFLSNNFLLPADQIALIYKHRWKIELLFKKTKQNFQLKYFLGDSENAIKIQIWCALIAQLLLAVLQKGLKRNWAFSNMVSIIRFHLMSYIDVIKFLNHPEKAWAEVNSNKPPPLQQSLTFAI